MIYGYARCSTNEERQDINRQKRELHTLGVTDEKCIYWEYESGMKDDRKKEVSYAYKDHIVASDGQIYSLSSKDIQKEKYFRWLCAIILFLIMAAMKIKDMWRKRRQT